MSPAERADTFERALRPALRILADPASPLDAVAFARDVLDRVTQLIDALHAAPRESGRQAVPMESTAPHDARARAREAEPGADEAHLRVNGAREADGLHGIRKGRLQCEATTRAGARCKAPAIPGGSVCRRHGGGARQVRIQAAMTVRYETRFEAARALEAARGTPGEFDALCAWSRADNAVKEGEAKLERIRQLRAELRSRQETKPEG